MADLPVALVHMQLERPKEDINTEKVIPYLCASLSTGETSSWGSTLFQMVVEIQQTSLKTSVHILKDDGATHNFILYAFAEKNGLEVKKTY